MTDSNKPRMRILYNEEDPAFVFNTGALHRLQKLCVEKDSVALSIMIGSKLDKRIKKIHLLLKLEQPNLIRRVYDLLLEDDKKSSNQGRSTPKTDDEKFVDDLIDSHCKSVLKFYLEV